MIDPSRTLILNKGKNHGGTVVYWMSRDQRVRDNWALLAAQKEALEGKLPLVIVFCLVDDFIGATLRAYDFMLRGLMEVERCLSEKNIPLYLLKGLPEEEIPRFCNDISAGSLYTDFDPLKPKIRWQKDVARVLRIPFYVTDAHNIVPCWEASSKKEFAARTFRPRIRGKLQHYLKPFPPLAVHQYNGDMKMERTDFEKVIRNLNVDSSVPPVSWVTPGADAGREVFEHFVKHRLPTYDNDRNDPNRKGQSNLSPYLHFGQISPQRVALEIQKLTSPGTGQDAFIEELIVRRELSDNFCYYEINYDSFDGFHPWAQKSLNEHREDRREYLYSLKELDERNTHDPLWNSAQNEMTVKGKMNGWVRMYWAKKILEWTESPEQALSFAQYLNDRYELDGRDPNGYTGVAWSIGGIHDRAWQERKVYGKIRYMNYNGAKRKFDVNTYINENQKE